jgi:hypothetical protein
LGFAVLVAAPKLEPEVVPAPKVKLVLKSPPEV